MTRILSGVAISELIAVVGCDDMSSEEEDPAPNPALAGKWDVISVNGNAVPEDGSIEIDDRRDGEVSLEGTGNLSGVPPVIPGEVEQSFAGSSSTIQGKSMHLKANGAEVRVRRAQPGSPGATGINRRHRLPESHEARSQTS